MGHQHNHHHHSSSSSFNVAFAIAVALNLSFTIVQVIYAFLSNSMGLMADAAHNFGDVCGLLLAWGASWLLTRPARQRYSYGYKRTTILASLTNALLLVATSTLIAFESIYRLLHIGAMSPWTVIWVAAIGILINGGTALLFMKGAKEDLNLKGAFFHLIADALISIGVVISGVIILWSGWMWVDPLVGLLIVAIILLGTWGLLRDSVRLILDAVPHHIDQQGIYTFLQKWPGVEAVHDLHIWGLSTKEIALTAHLVMPKAMLSNEDYQKINALLKSKYRVDHATLQVEKGSVEHPCERAEVC